MAEIRLGWEKTGHGCTTRHGQSARALAHYKAFGAWGRDVRFAECLRFPEALAKNSLVPDTPWPHAPSHQLAEGGTFLVTAATYQKEHYFREICRLDVLHRGLLTVARDFRWHLEAWAVFSNHYHFIGHSPAGGDAANLTQMLAVLHAKTSGWINRLDRLPGRRVWHNFYESRLTFTQSYLARSHYVHANAVKHGLVPVANQYPWCSAAWFERTAGASMVKSIYRFKIDGLKVADDYEPCQPE